MIVHPERATRIKVSDDPARPGHKLYETDPNVALKTLPYSDEHGVVFECKVQHPPSAVGRTVYVRFSPEEADAALREFREYAIRRRQTSMSRRQDPTETKPGR